MDNLDLSFKDMRTLYQKVDSLPDRCGPWYTKVLSFLDNPEEQFIVRYRNSLEAVKALLGDPTLQNDIVYRPSRIFRREGGRNVRIIHEMWTADWWWELQVSRCSAFTVKC